MFFIAALITALIIIFDQILNEVKRTKPIDRREVTTSFFRRLF